MPDLSHVLEWLEWPEWTLCSGYFRAILCVATTSGLRNHALFSSCFATSELYYIQQLLRMCQWILHGVDTRWSGCHVWHRTAVTGVAAGCGVSHMMPTSQPWDPQAAQGARWYGSAGQIWPLGCIIDIQHRHISLDCLAIFVCSQMANIILQTKDMRDCIDKREIVQYMVKAICTYRIRVGVLSMPRSIIHPP